MVISLIENTPAGNIAKLQFSKWVELYALTYMRYRVVNGQRTDTMAHSVCGNLVGKKERVTVILRHYGL